MLIFLERFTTKIWSVLVIFVVLFVIDVLTSFWHIFGLFGLFEHFFKPNFGQSFLDIFKLNSSLSFPFIFSQFLTYFFYQIPISFRPFSNQMLRPVFISFWSNFEPNFGHFQTQLTAPLLQVFSQILDTKFGHFQTKLKKTKSHFYSSALNSDQIFG